MRKNQKGEFLSSRVRYIAIGAVRPNPAAAPPQL